tara:strand:- start:69 stop:203 length:135 start_codon:yes stop_codon:yes gene_type:complete
MKQYQKDYNELRKTKTHAAAFIEVALKFNDITPLTFNKNKFIEI